MIRRVGHRREERPVESDPTGFVIDLVLVALPLWNLDDDLELHLATSSPPAAPWTETYHTDREMDDQATSSLVASWCSVDLERSARPHS